MCSRCRIVWSPVKEPETGVYYANCRAVFFLSATFALISGGNEGKHNGDKYTGRINENFYTDSLTFLLYKMINTETFPFL